MKNSIKLTLLFLLLFSGTFASNPLLPKTIASTYNDIVIDELFTKICEKVSLAENLLAKALITISDKSNNVLFKGTLADKKGLTKRYNLLAL